MGHQHTLALFSNQDGAQHYVCTQAECGEMFVPVDVAVQAVAVEQEALDKATGVMAAMLWDLHERAVAKYGKQVADAVAPPEQGEHEHEWNLGRCETCGASMFLGE